MRKLSFILVFLFSFISLFSQVYALYPCIIVTSNLNPSEASPGSTVTVYGNATYDTDFGGGPVAGAFVMVTIENQTGNWTTHTNSYGDFDLEIVAPDSPGDYTVVTFITDFTCYDVIEKVLNIKPIPTTTIPPPTTTTTVNTTIPTTIPPTTTVNTTIPTTIPPTTTVNTTIPTTTTIRGGGGGKYPAMLFGLGYASIIAISVAVIVMVVIIFGIFKYFAKK